MKLRASLELALLTALALTAFAANSILCRIALRDAGMDPASFTLLRIGSGALTLALLLRWRGQRLAGDWLSALALLVYAAAFSFAYVSIPAGIGALLLFGSVQVTMISRGLLDGERPRRLEWLGFALALLGLTALLWPGLQAPPLAAAGLMILAGIAWGLYSLRGRRRGDPLAATAGNFLRALPLAAAIWLLERSTETSPRAVMYALASGALASGLGYAIWYRVLPQLSAIRAGLVQLSVPILVAAIGVLVLREPLTNRLLWCSTAVLGGLALVLLKRPRGSRSAR